MAGCLSFLDFVLFCVCYAVSGIYFQNIQKNKLWFKKNVLRFVSIEFKHGCLLSQYFAFLIVKEMSWMYIVPVKCFSKIQNLIHPDRNTRQTWLFFTFEFCSFLYSLVQGICFQNILKQFVIWGKGYCFLPRSTGSNMAILYLCVLSFLALSMWF